VVLAVPVAPVSVAAAFGDVADTVACLETPRRFVAIGGFYQDFRQLSDAEVFELLRSAAPPDGEITFDADGLTLGGRLTRPLGASAVVVFAHGSGSSRSSPRNRFVADRLADAGFATLLLDLLTPDEAQERRQVFDVIGLAARLWAGTRWLAAQPGASALRLGYFGASTGAAAALIAAAAPDSAVAAVVSRGGRPDLAGDALAAVRAPTLLIVGGRDESVLALNRAAQARLRCRSRLEIVPGAAHLFEEPGALDGVARLAEAWFRRYLAVE
jgi:dienelactone hydrolase